MLSFCLGETLIFQQKIVKFLITFSISKSDLWSCLYLFSINTYNIVEVPMLLVHTRCFCTQYCIISFGPFLVCLINRVYLPLGSSIRFSTSSSKSIMKLLYSRGFLSKTSSSTSSAVYCFNRLQSILVISVRAAMIKRSYKNIKKKCNLFVQVVILNTEICLSEVLFCYINLFFT